jgi:hypothetical protein
MSRIPPAYPEYQFTSGYAVHVRLLGPQTLTNIARAVNQEWADKKPTPPTEEINGVLQENDAHPDYLVALSTHQDAVNTEVGKRVMTLLADYALVAEHDESDIAAYKQAMAAIGTPVPDDVSDGFIFLWHLCATSQEEIQDFMAFALSQGKPTPEGTKSHRDSFRGNVSGARYLVRAGDDVGIES